MDATRFDIISRALRTPAGRRALLSLPLSGALAAIGVDAEAKKRRKKKKKKPPRLSCQELCGFTCEMCMFRADAPPLCGSGSTSCDPCKSDNDCVGSTKPYCATHSENRTTGEVVTSCNAGLCSCAPGVLGVCIAVDVCGA
jgi:hypothetical protein